MNVITVVVDSLRQDAISPYNSRWETPNIDRIADQSVVFEDVTAASCWTMPSHVSIFSGLYPSNHRAMEPFLKINKNVGMINEILYDNGYETHAINIPHPLSGDSGFNRGWTEWQNSYALPKPQQALRLLYSWATIGLMTEPFEAIKPKYFNRLRWNYRTQHAVNDVANRVNKSGDRFVFTNIFSAHADYRPFPRHAPDVSEDAWELSKVTRNGDGNNIRARYNYADLRDEYSERVVKETRELYQSEVQWVDENLGDLWDELKRTGRLEDTVVIITSDHGELFGESEEVPLSHRNSLHPALIDVPLLIYHPHMQPDRESRLVSHVDIAPTILDITDIDAGYRMDGRSVFGEESHEVVFAEHGPQELVDKHEFLREKWNADLGPLELDRKVARSSSTTVRLRSDRSRVVHDRQQESNDTNDEEADELANLIHNELTWVEEMEKESIDEKNVQQQLDDLGYI